MKRREKLAAEQIADLIMTLVGEVEPVGETNEDNRRHDNLIRLQDVMDYLLDEINMAYIYKDRQEYSMRELGIEAAEWMNDMREWLNGKFKDGEY